MKKLILSTLTLVLSLFTYAQNTSEPATTEHSEWLTTFSEVSVDGPLNVTFIKVPTTEAPKITYDTKGAYTSKFKAEVKNKVLFLSERTDARRNSTTEVKIYYSVLEKIDISKAIVTFQEPLDNVMIDVVVRNGAVFTSDLALHDLKMDISGDSKAVLTGNVRYLTLSASDSVVDAQKLEVVSAMITSSNSSEVSVNVTDRLEAKTSTKGKITHKGSAIVIRKTVAFLGGEIMQAK
ncbi:MAG: DUF2807 domain-containing protein [Alistipes sp.]